MGGDFQSDTKITHGGRTEAKAGYPQLEFRTPAKRHRPEGKRQKRKSEAEETPLPRPISLPDEQRGFIVNLAQQLWVLLCEAKRRLPPMHARKRKALLWV